MSERRHPMHDPVQLRAEVRKLNGPNPLPIERDLVDVMGVLNGRVKQGTGLTHDETKRVQEFITRWAG